MQDVRHYYWWKQWQDTVAVMQAVRHHYWWKQWQDTVTVMQDVRHHYWWKQWHDTVTVMQDVRHHYSRLISNRKTRRKEKSVEQRNCQTFDRHRCRHVRTLPSSSNKLSAAAAATTAAATASTTTTKTVSTYHNFWRERRAEADSNRGPSAYQSNALPLGQTGSLRIPFVRCCFTSTVSK